MAAAIVGCLTLAVVNLSPETKANPEPHVAAVRYRRVCPPMPLGFLRCDAEVVPLAFVGQAHLAGIKLSPSAGPPTTTTTVIGQGFGPNEAVGVAFDGVFLELIHADVAGNFTEPITIPNDALPGIHAVAVKGRSTGLKARTRFLARTDWAMFHSDPALTGVNPYENVLGPDTVSGLELSWTGGLTLTTVYADPVVWHGQVFVGAYNVNNEGELSAFSTSCSSSPCTPTWRAKLGGGPFTGPAVSEGLVFQPDSSDTLYAFPARCPKVCHPVWTAPYGGGQSSPVVSGGLVYIGSYFDGVYAFPTTCGGATCTPVWHRPVSGEIFGAPAVANGVVYVGTWAGTVYALDAATGAPIWVNPCCPAGAINDSVAVADGKVFVAATAYDFRVLALDAATGHTLWSTPELTDFEGAPAVANGVVYIGGYSDSTLYAIDAVSGAILWTGKTSSYIHSSPAVANGVVYVADDAGLLYAFPAECGAATCAPLWKAPVPNQAIRNSPAVADGRVYIANTVSLSDPAQLYAFGLAP
jgi:outer membrane protein assembly factor BamB